MNSFFLALQFLTIIPVQHSFIANDKQFGYSCLFFPVIGLLIGILLALSTLLITDVAIQIQATIILIAWVMLTGGLHLDGLADCADAWVGGLGSHQRSLEIMKDPAAGPVAVVVLLLLLLLKWSILIDVLEKQAIEVLILAPMLGRLAILILMLSTNYMRSAGLGEKMVTNLPKSSAIVISFIGVLAGFYFLEELPIIFMLIMLFIIRYQANKRLSGVTGDVYGAAVELVEASILLGVVV